MAKIPKFDNVSRLTIDKLNDDGCFKLLESFLAYMADDYCSALINYLRNKSDKENYNHYLRTRNFFLSDYFTNLTDLCGEDIVSRLDAKIIGRQYAGSH